MNQVPYFSEIFIYLLCVLGRIWIIDKFCKNYLESTKRKEFLFVIFLFGGSLLLNIGEVFLEVPYIIFALLCHIFFMGLVLLMFRAEVEKKILAASLLIAALTLAGNFCESFLSCITLFILHTVNNNPSPFLGRIETNLIICMESAIEILLVFWMSKHLISLFCSKTKRWYVILAVPLLAVTAVIEVANWGASNGILVKSGENMGWYYDQIFSHAEICVLAGLSMFASGVYVFGMNRIYLEQRKSGQYYSQIAVYKMLEEQHRQTERLRHDMKNHIIALTGLLKNKEWEKMDSYLKELEKNSGLGDGQDVTGNKAVDALLYQKRKLAEKSSITWESDVQIPKECHIHEFDLCVLFGNILDNGVEECERLKGKEGTCFITVQAKAVKKCFLLEVKNSTDMTELHETGFTKKENPQKHGIGLLNVRDVVDRYDGVMDIKAANGVFTITILLPFQDTVHDIKPAI